MNWGSTATMKMMPLGLVALVKKPVRQRFCQLLADSVSSPCTGDLSPARHWQKRCLTGFLTNATNPKGIIFMVAVLPQFMTESRPLWTQLAVMAATTVTVDVVVMHGYAAGASALRRLMRSARAVRTQNRVFGGLLMAVGAGLFFVKRGGQHA